MGTLIAGDFQLLGRIPSETDHDWQEDFLLCEQHKCIDHPATVDAEIPDIVDLNA